MSTGLTLAVGNSISRSTYKGVREFMNGGLRHRHVSPVFHHNRQSQDKLLPVSMEDQSVSGPTDGPSTRHREGHHFDKKNSNN